MSVLVYCEVSGGALKKASLEALSEGKKLAGALSGGLSAVVVGSGLDAHIDAIKNYGADKIFVLDGADHANYIPEAHLSAIADAAGQAGATVCLIPATIRGRELAPRVAVKLDTALVGSLISSTTSPDERFARISIRKVDLNPISISSPSYWQLRRSLAEMEKSISCAEILSWFPVRASFTRLLAWLENTETRFRVL